MTKGMLASVQAVLLVGLAGPVLGQKTFRVSVGPARAQGDSHSSSPSISADGRFVAFESDAGNLVPGDWNGESDVFVRDRWSSTTERVSIHSAGVPAHRRTPRGPEGPARSHDPSISADGRFVAFTSESAHLVPGDTNYADDVFVRDRLSGTTERVSVASAGTQGDYDSGFGGLSISADGRYVAFASRATNLVPGDTNVSVDVFVRDCLSGTTERVSIDSAGTQGNGTSGSPSISADGSTVAFQSLATNLVPGDTNGHYDVFVRDRPSGTTERVSVASAGAQGNQDSWHPSVSADGRHVAFGSLANNLVAGDTALIWDVFVRDRQAGTTERISVGPAGRQGNGDSIVSSISADGRHVAYSSLATNLAPGDTTFLNFADVYVHDRLRGTTSRVSVDPTGTPGDSVSYDPAISADGLDVAYSSRATDLVPGDTNGADDVFVTSRVPEALRR